MKKIHTLIIGGTRGGGRTLLKLLSKEKHTLSIIGKRIPSALDQRLSQIHFWTLDLTNEKYLLKACSEITQQNGLPDNLVFFQRYRGQGNDWTEEINISLTATKNIIEYFASNFKRNGHYSIVIVSSLAGHFIADEQPLSYHVAKAALNQMVRYYATTLGNKGTRVNAVSFGTILKEESKNFYLHKNKKLLSLYKKIIPLHRMGTSEDIANVIAFLCSSKASFITGQNIIIDGGLSLQGHETLARKLTSIDHLRITRPTSKKLQYV